MNINGFEIDKRNIYNLKEGQKNHTCPLCSHTRKKKTDKCFTAFWDTGLGKCFHCGEIVQLHTFKKKNNDTDYSVPEKINSTRLNDKTLEWFQKRGISQFIIRLMKISEGLELMPDKKSPDWKKKNTVQFNYYRFTKLVNIKYRSGDKCFKLYKGAEKMPYNLDNIVGRDVIYLVEGEMDVLAVMEAGIHNVTSPPNGFTEKGNINLDWLNNDVEHFINAEKLILAFDNDVPGENGKREFIRRFGAHKCYSVDLKDCKDANEFLITHGREALKEAMENHLEIPLENVGVYDNVRDSVRKFLLEGMPKGMVTKTLRTFDNNFSVNTSHIVLVTGAPSSGKSDVVDQMVIGYCLNYDMKAAYASPENKPNELHYQKILRKLHGKVPRATSDFNDSFEAAEKFLNDHFFMIDMDVYDLEKVLMKARELVYRKGIRVLVIDPFNKVRLKSKIESSTGNQINDYTNQYLTLLNSFAAELDVLIVLVAHPIKLQKMANGKRPIPDFYDVKGGGEMYDMCHHGIVIHRDYDYKLSLIRTLKVKFSHLGENNVDCWYKYNINNGRFTEIAGDPTKDMDSIEIRWDNDNWVTKKINQHQGNELPFDEYNQDNWVATTEEIDDPPF